MHRINLLTSVNATRAALPHLLESGAGRIVNVGAAGAVKALAGMGPYAASKAGVMRFTEALAEELKTKGVTVNAVLPSIIDTPQNRADMPDADPAQWVTPGDLGGGDAVPGLAGGRGRDRRAVARDRSRLGAPPAATFFQRMAAMIRTKASRRSAKTGVCSSRGMSSRPTSAWLSARSPKAIANTANRLSPVRRQKRAKKTLATPKPMARAPVTKVGRRLHHSTSQMKP
jgi:NAD(P)-dependent dehydrogenase (short-subunit alcohol dehydrogenase family)